MSIHEMLADTVDSGPHGGRQRRVALVTARYVT